MNPIPDHLNLQDQNIWNLHDLYIDYLKKEPTEWQHRYVFVDGSVETMFWMTYGNLYSKQDWLFAFDLPTDLKKWMPGISVFYYSVIDSMDVMWCKQVMAWAQETTSNCLIPSETPYGPTIRPVSGSNPDSKVHGAHMRPTWGRQDPCGPHVGPVIYAIWEVCPL